MRMRVVVRRKPRPKVCVPRRATRRLRWRARVGFYGPSNYSPPGFAAALANPLAGGDTSGLAKPVPRYLLEGLRVPHAAGCNGLSSYGPQNKQPGRLANGRVVGNGQKLKRLPNGVIRGWRWCHQNRSCWTTRCAAVHHATRARWAYLRRRGRGSRCGRSQR